MLLLRRFAPLLLVLSYVWMAASVSKEHGTTFDEIPHLTAGYLYWKRGEYRFQPENGNFPQRWAALPLLWLRPNLGEPPEAAWRVADVWGIGYGFFFQSGNEPARLLAAGRTMIALLGAALVAIVFLWSRRVFGPAGGWCSLLLAAFCPHLLAHGGLATSDMAAALGFMAAVLAWWQLCHRITPVRLLLAGAAFGFLALAKYSAALLLPVAIGVAIVRLLRPAPLLVSSGARRWLVRGKVRWIAIGGAGVFAGACAVLLIWASYGFRYAAAPGSDPVSFNKSWDDVLLTSARADFALVDGRSAIEADANLSPGVVQRFVRTARAWRLLPEAYLYGLAFVDRHARARLAYFAGDYRATGWWDFFPVAFALKTTLPALGLVALGLLLLARPGRGTRRLLYRTSPLLILLAVYWTFSILSPLNIGHRHLLPVYPAIYVLAGIVGLQMARTRWLSAVVLPLLAWHVAVSVWIRPHYLAYFNALAGGPSNGHRYFVDSSLDWGQELPGLKRWLERNARGEKVFLSYFGSDSPVHHGIEATRVGDTFFDFHPRPALPVMTGGLYCISATMLRQVYTHARGPWTESYDDAYWELVKWLRHLNERPENAPPVDIEDREISQAELQRRLILLEQMRFARLCHYLQRRQPDASVGYSIFIYRLTTEEVTFALLAPLPALNAAVHSAHPGS